MASRQDELHSYQFSVQRVVAALVLRETDPPRSPFRRLAGATLAGVLVTALVVAGYALWGVLRPGGSDAWRTGRSLIVEKESGAAYLYLDGRLHPVLNYTSAALILGARPAVLSVARRSLAGTPRGARLGLPGAPESLPGRVAGGPWSVCSRGPDPVVLVGSAPAGGVALGAGGLLAVADGVVYLLWNGHRLLVREPEVVLGSLVWRPPVPVAPALLNALPAGPDITRVAVRDRGRPAAHGARVGEVFVTEQEGGGRQYGVAVATGLAPVTAFQAALLLGDPLTASVLRQREAVRVSPGEFTARRVEPLPAPAGLPATVPALAEPGGAVCAVVAATVEVQLSASVPGEGVQVRPGTAALVEAMPSPDAPEGVVSLVSDLGVRYPLADRALLGVLGYGREVPLRLPAEVVALLPLGCTLDASAARLPAR